MDTRQRCRQVVLLLSWNNLQESDNSDANFVFVSGSVFPIRFVLRNFLLKNKKTRATLYFKVT